MDSVISQLESAGLIIDGLPEIGRLVRCKADGDRGDKKSGWYVLHELILDSGLMVFVGRYGNWKTMGPESLSISPDIPLSAYDRDRVKQQTKIIREQAETEKKLRAANAAERARDIWDGLPETGTSDYLVRKQVRAFGVRFSRGSIVVPVRSVNGELAGLQFIYGDGTKKFLTGTAKQGAFHLIGVVSPDVPLCICEGYATAATIHFAMDMRWPVAVAFDAGNLTPVAKALRAKYPDQKIIVCADNDFATLGNPGVTKAREAAIAIGASLAVPEFSAEVAA